MKTKKISSPNTLTKDLLACGFAFNQLHARGMVFLGFLEQSRILRLKPRVESLCKEDARSTPYLVRQFEQVYETLLGITLTLDPLEE